MTPIAAVSSPQVALLMRYHRVQVGAVMTALLMELATKKKCMWDDHTVAGIAKSLLTQFWMLRFDEFVYIFRAGMRGRYGKVTFAELTESDLTQWIVKYQETERLEAEEILRNKEKQAWNEATEGIENIVGPEAFASLAHKFKVQDIEEKGRAMKPVRANDLDDSQLSLFRIYKSGYTDEQLQLALINSKKWDFYKTAEAIELEIEERSLHNRIYDLAEKISRGYTDFNEQELQLQSNYPKQLEIVLLELKQLNNDGK